MFILVISDTHGNVEDLRRVIANYDNLDLVIFLGDGVKDVYKIRVDFPEIPFEIVAGNNDWFSSEPIEKLLMLEDKKIWIAHGHTYQVKQSTKNLIAKAHSMGADAVFFGHTHLADEFYDQQLLVLNPGSLGCPSVYQGPTFCELEIKEGKFSTNFKTLL